MCATSGMVSHRVPGRANERDAVAEHHVVLEQHHALRIDAFDAVLDNTNPIAAGRRPPADSHSCFMTSSLAISGTRDRDRASCGDLAC